MRELDVTLHAQGQILEITLWWLDNRDKAPALFEDELEAAFSLLLRVPHVGQVWSRKHPDIRRYLLPKSRYHVYYSEADDVLTIVAVWGGPRGSGPDLGDHPLG